ncbi:MAG: sulfate ABC transporter permease subunit CysT [Vicinamibacterales bacterium]
MTGAVAGASNRALPGFRATLGFTVAYLAVVVLIPLAMLPARLVAEPSALGRTLVDPRVLASFRLTLGASAAAAIVHGVFGLVAAWVLVRYAFPGRRVLDALVDLPFALPTAVAGITLTTLYAPTGWLGGPLARAGVPVAFTPVGIAVALVFIGLPFVIRTLQPVIADLDPEIEQAATSLGASRGQVLARVILPTLAPAWLTGLTLAFARGLGEYGAVVFIAGNMPYRTEVPPLLILTRLEEYDYGGAVAVAFALLALSFLLLLAINALQGWTARRVGA